ncbi:MAG: DUF4391 domain-containing protein, partial [Thaumarchaeota archaeon]|nr:DUF4391 domain-containing protein [Nitrososphaerota archaeon]
CAQCKTVNTSDAHVCMNCRMALDTQTAVAMIRERQNSEQQLRAEYEKFKRITRLTLLLDRETDPARRVEIATELEKLLD